MNGLFAVPVSGLNAQAKRLGVSAQNVANITSTGVRSDPPAADDDGYVPQRVVATAETGGGVRAQSVPVSPPSTFTYDPGAPDADAEGVVARPNVSLEQETVNQIEAKRVYEANLRVIEAIDETVGELLDIES